MVDHYRYISSVPNNIGVGEVGEKRHLHRQDLPNRRATPFLHQDMPPQQGKASVVRVRCSFIHFMHLGS